MLRKNFKSSGQVTVEYILLGAVLALMFTLVTNQLKTRGALDNFLNTPHEIFKNLLETGNMLCDGDDFPTEPCKDPLATRYHPNSHEMHYTSDPRP